MHPNPRRIIPVVVVVGLIAFSVWYFTRPAAAQTNALTASGTIEATTVHIGPEIGGRVKAVEVEEGQTVTAKQTLIQFDVTLLEAQRAQAQAAAQAANSAVEAARASHAAAQANNAAARANQAAAQANLALLRAGPSAEQLKVAQTVVDRAQQVVDVAQEAYDDLSEAAQDTTQGKALKNQLDAAQSNLANVQAQYDLTKAGARSEQIAVAQAQVEATQAQVDATQAQVDATQAQIETAQSQAEAANAAVGVINTQIQKLTLIAPIDGTVLVRSIEPGEFAAPGATLLTIAQLDNLLITVYVPEDRVGTIKPGQTVTVKVDSFPDQAFTATVTRIADRAEFTPRNVQTASGRKTTVFAVILSIMNVDGKLKPGMPADVNFGE